MRVYRMLPGHGNKGGKIYSFLGQNGMRVGQRVVAPYRHWKSGNIHDTMWTIMQSNDADSQYATAEIDRLSETKTKAGRDAQLRLIKGTNILEGLQGGQKYEQLAKERGMSESQTKALWSLDSNIKYRQSRNFDTRNKEKARDIILGLNPKQDNTEAAKRILGG